MERLLPALEGLPPAYLVGGAVRDLLRGADGRRPRPGRRGRRALGRRGRSPSGSAARRASTSASAPRRCAPPDLVFDLATTRTETYDEPGALPRVAAATLGEDLRRRDFTVNAMAVALAGDDLGHLHDPHGGLADLEAGLVRVLHPGSFLDDPTRLLRAVRYETRLGFRWTQDTERAARAAVAEDALATVSGARVRDELMDLLAEHEAPAAVERMRELGPRPRAPPGARPDPELVGLGVARRGGDRRRPRRWPRWRRCAPERPRSSTRGWPACSSRRASATRSPRAAAGRAGARRASCARASACRRSCATCSAASRPRRWRWRWRWARPPSRSCAGRPT